MKRHIFIAIISLLLLPLFGKAQFWKYDDYKKIEGVDFKYKWINEDRFNKKSPLALSLKILNTNDFKVNVKFGVEYFWQVKRVGYSGVREFCLLPGEMLVGRINDLVYEIKDYSNKQIKSDDFSWQLFDVSISETENCKSLFFKEE